MVSNGMNPEFAALLEKANAGDVKAMVKVGNALRNGNKRLGVSTDFEAGVEWLTKAADAGSAEAMKFLASAYARVMKSGTYFDFGALKKHDYWRDRLRKATDIQSASEAPVLVGKGKNRIGRMVFRDRSDLVRIEIAPSVQSIGYSAFENCVELESVVIPASVTSIEFRAFSGCKKLKRLELPEGVVSVADDAFEGCESLESVKFSNSVAEIGTDAFRNCGMLSRIEFGSGLKRLGCAAFRACKSLKSVVLPASLQVIEQAVFEDCSLLEDVKLPQSVERLGWSLFEECTSLASIELPAVKKIEGHMFKGCTRLRSVIAAQPIEEIDDFVFLGCSSLERVVLPQGLKKICRCAFNDCTSLREIEIPDSVEKIEHECFKGCTALERFGGGRAAQYSSGVFAECAKLPDIISDGVLIHPAAISGHVKIPNGVTRIANCAFYERAKITSIEFPATLEEIGREAFYGCSGIQEIVLPVGVRQIGVKAFEGCESLTRVVLPPRMENVPLCLFEGCRKLATVSLAGTDEQCDLCVLPQSVKRIESSAFKGCGLKKVRISPDVVELENWAFADCGKLSEIDLPKSLSKIGFDVFENCTGLKKIHLPYCVGYTEGDVNLSLFSGCAFAEAIIPCYLESKVDKLFGDNIPPVLSLEYEDGSVRPWIREEKAEDRAFFAEYGFHRYEVKYSFEKACDFWAGCRIQSPAKESRSVVIPDKYKDGDGRKLVAKIYARGASKTYSISTDEGDLESYSLQRDAKASKFWPVFAGLAAYRPG